MQFSASGSLKKILRTPRDLVKCQLEDAFSKIMVMVPENLLKEIEEGDEVEVKGQIRGFELQNKIYNNLFVKELVKTKEKFFLVNANVIDESEHLEILEKNERPFTYDEIIAKYFPDSNLEDQTDKIQKLLKKKRILEEAGSYYNLNAFNVKSKLSEGLITIEGNNLSLSDEISLVAERKEKCPFLFFRKGTSEVREIQEEILLNLKIEALNKISSDSNNK